jgi:hypothetical protein
MHPASVACRLLRESLDTLSRGPSLRLEDAGALGHQHPAGVVAEPTFGGADVEHDVLEQGVAQVEPVAGRPSRYSRSRANDASFCWAAPLMGVANSW